jgi:amino acid transporter
VSTVFSVAKLLPMLLFVSVGFFAMDAARFEPFAPEGYGPLAETTLLLLYAYVGFEVLVVPAGEMRNPQRNVPIALLAVLAIVSLVYGAVLAVSIGVFDGIAGHKNPVAAASGVLMGTVGGTIVAAGIVVSVFGTNAGQALVSPRRIYAMAERGDLPRQLAWVHPKSGAPIPAIVVMYVLAAVLTVSGSFKELAVLGVMARFMQYIPTCLAVIVLRRRDAEGARPGFRLPGGPVVPLVAVALCCWLIANSQPRQLWMGAAALALGAPLYLLSRRLRASKT